MNRFSVEKVELVSDHLSTRFFIKDNEMGKCYDVRHSVSEGYEIQFDSWAENICDLLNSQEDYLNKVLSNLDALELSIMELMEKYKDDPEKISVLKEIRELKVNGELV